MSDPRDIHLAIHRRERKIIVALAEELGYGNILGTVAAAWADAPTMGPASMASWLRGLAEEIENRPPSRAGGGRDALKEADDG